MSPKSSYILCTVARNEEKYLPGVAADILSQTRPPSLWVLLDDRSGDKTGELMKELSSEHTWVRYYTYDGPQFQELGIHLSTIKSHGITLAMQIASEENISYEFIGILDADMRIPPDLFQKMIEQMLEDTTIGLMSAKIQEVGNDGTLYLKESRDDLPGCATMFCRRKCFEDIGGISADSYPEDAIMVAKAKLKNWETRRVKYLFAIQRRKTSSAAGLRKGFKYEGEKIYFLRYNFFYIIVRAIYISIFNRFDYGIAFLWGYFKKLLASDKRLEDAELIRYFRKERFKEILKYRFKRLLRIFA